MVNSRVHAPRALKIKNLFDSVQFVSGYAFFTLGTLTRAYRAWLLYLVKIAASLDAQEQQVHRILLRRSPARRIA
jgi:hypothetical protein